MEEPLARAVITGHYQPPEVVDLMKKLNLVGFGEA